MDVQALVAGLFGAGIGAGVCYLLVRRDWLAASGGLAIGAAALLSIIAEGDRSRGEHTVVFAVTMGLMLYFAVIAVVRQRRARSVPHPSATHSS
jgi:hypothetical protein